MAFQRRSNFKRRSFSRGSPSRRGRLHNVTAPKRWEVAAFNVGGVISPPAGAGGLTLSMFHLASIGISLQQETGIEPINTLLGSMARKMLIGGIVFDWGVEIDGPIMSVDDADAREGRLATHVELCVDELVTPGVGDTFPNAIQGYEPFTSGFPTSIFQPAQTTPPASSRDDLRPLRTLWTKRELRYMTSRAAVPADVNLTVPNEQHLAPRHHTVNKRLRIVLDDSQGLFWTVATANLLGFNVDTANRPIFAWCFGQLYYRVQF